MPQQGAKYGGALTDAEIIAVVCHERFTIAGANPLDPKYVPGVRRLVRAGRAEVRGRQRRRARRSTKRASARRPRPEQPVPSTRVVRGPRRRRRPGRGVGRVLARPPRPRRRRRRAQDVPSREDLRRRPDAPRREAAAGHGPRRRAGQVPPLRRPALHRAGTVAGAGVARAPRVPQLRLRRAPPRPRLDGGVERRGGGGDPAPGRRRDRAGRSTAGSCAARWSRPPDAAVARRAAGPLRRGGRRRQQPLRPGPRHVPRPRSGPTARPSARTGRAPPRRAVDRVRARRQGPQREPAPRLRLDLPGRRRQREHRRRAALHVPGLQERQHHPPARQLRAPGGRALGDRRADTRRPARSAAGSRWAARSGPSRAPPTWWSATPPAR